jgi:hypothetical protein
MNSKRLKSRLFALSLFSFSAMAADPPFPNAPEGAAAFGPMIGDHACVMKYAGADGELTESAGCRWNWYYKFDGHMVQDDFYMFDAAGNVAWSGSTLRTWEPGKDRWNNMFLGAHGTGFGKMFHGQPVDDEIHIELEASDPDGTPHLLRIFFNEVKDGKFRWRQERSNDGGETWKLNVTVDITGPIL